MKTNSPSICPRCGQNNQCALMANLPPAQCWCMQLATVTALAKEAGDNYCLCQTCLKQAAHDEN